MSGPSTKDMSLLNRLIMDPVSVFVKNDCGARVTTSRSFWWNLRPVEGAIHTHAVLIKSATYQTRYSRGNHYQAYPPCPKSVPKDSRKYTAMNIAMLVPLLSVHHFNHSSKPTISLDFELRKWHTND